MNNLISIFSFIFFGASIFATLALYTRQTLIIAYIILGLISGPYCLNIIQDVSFLHEISDIGIIFLLFLLGLHIEIENLLKILNKALFVTIISSGLFVFSIICVCYFFGIGRESYIIGIALIFSSTIICLKLLPNSVLYNKRVGQLVVAILLIQDLLAVLSMTAVSLWSSQNDSSQLQILTKFFLALPILSGAAYVARKYFLLKLLHKFSPFKEYTFLISIGWSLGLAQAAVFFGLPNELGAFIAGIAITNSPVSKYVYECLTPLKNFFLILFFFSTGAEIEINYLPLIWKIVAILTTLVLILKPLLHYLTLWILQESKSESLEVGIRLGQSSEFSLILISLVSAAGLITNLSSMVVKTVTIASFILSSYIVVLKYPMPIESSECLKHH